MSGPAKWFRAGPTAVVACGLVLVLATGCGGPGVDLVDVEGHVTLDGKPLPEATIIFTSATPESGTSRPSMAQTDDSGWYQLQYSTEHSGVRPGKYRVTITTFRPQSLDSLEKVIPRLPELVPETYNSKSTLEIDVKEGATFDFELKSDAPVVQPDAPRR
jgi:hypothetical protein